MTARATRSALRIIDANANRALEGLRVGEEIVRFHLEDAPVLRRLRTLRHDVAQAVNRLPVGSVELVRSRNSSHDLGKRAQATAVGSLERLALINLQRAKESLRTLEECTRLVAPRRTPEFQRLRFRTYEVERDLLIRLQAVRHH